MPLQFTKEEVEEGLSGTLAPVTRKDIALKSGLSESYIKRQFNSNDELQTSAFQTLLIGCAVRDTNAEAGERFWNQLNDFYELSRVRKAAKEDLTPFDCLSQKLQLDGKLGTMLADALKDGKLDRQEVQQLQNMVDQLRSICDLFETMLGFELTKTLKAV